VDGPTAKPLVRANVVVLDGRRRTRGAGFEFLGFHHQKVASWRNRSRYWRQRWPSSRAMASIRAKVKGSPVPESLRTTGRR
jgi:hypothetical protein